jgi:hypothetical protein
VDRATRFILCYGFLVNIISSFLALRYDKPQTTKLLSDTSIFIDDTPSISALELRSKARRLHTENGLDLFIVDYLQFWPDIGFCGPMPYR